jgi:hypothetical protein
MKLHCASLATSKSPRRCNATCADASIVSILTFRPICRHWSMSQMAIGSYGWGTPRFLYVNVNPSGTPASRSRRRASARLAVMSCP